MQTVKAKIVPGHQVASGRSTKDLRFPGGTIRMQKPHFKQAGFDMDAFFGGDFVHGTLNLDISPRKFTIKSPEIFLRAVTWSDITPAENFFLSPAKILFKETAYTALIYIPDPATKPDHFQAPTVIEVIAQTIPGAEYGAEVFLHYAPDAIEISDE